MCALRCPSILSLTPGRPCMPVCQAAHQPPLSQPTDQPLNHSQRDAQLSAGAGIMGHDQAHAVHEDDDIGWEALHAQLLGQAHGGHEAEASGAWQPDARSHEPSAAHAAARHSSTRQQVPSAAHAWPALSSLQHTPHQAAMRAFAAYIKRMCMLPGSDCCTSATQGLVQPRGLIWAAAMAGPGRVRPAVQPRRCRGSGLGGRPAAGPARVQPAVQPRRCRGSGLAGPPAAAGDLRRAPGAPRAGPLRGPPQPGAP